MFAFLGYVPAVGLIAVLTTWVLVFKSSTPAFVAACCWMAFYLVAGIRFQTFKCPRCGKWFFAKWWYHNVFAGRCVQCGLRKYADPNTTGIVVETSLSHSSTLLPAQ